MTQKHDDSKKSSDENEGLEEHGTSSVDHLPSGHLLASYEIERFLYYWFEPPKQQHQGNVSCMSEKPTMNNMAVSIKSATATRGGNIVSGDFDATGIMIWPATHLLCQHLAQDAHETEGGVLGVRQRTVLELGCGCGLVGVVAMATSATQSPSLWVATDMDVSALQLSQENFALNGISNSGLMASIETTSGHRQGLFARRLEWGNQEDMNNIQSDLGLDRFDCIVGADIVYPNTCGKALTDLFQTVDRFLSKQDGSKFYLSFASRDGPRTPCRLLEAAGDAGFAISSSSQTLDPDIVQRLPPLLDSKLLVIQRSENAEEENRALGRDYCTVFPGLRASMARLEEPSSEEEWDAPFGD